MRVARFVLCLFLSAPLAAEAAIIAPYQALGAGEPSLTEGMGSYGVQNFGLGVYDAVAIPISAGEPVNLSDLWLRIVTDAIAPSAPQFSVSVNLFTDLSRFGASPLEGDLYHGDLVPGSLTALSGTTSAEGLPQWDLRLTLSDAESSLATLPGSGVLAVSISYAGDAYLALAGSSAILDSGFFTNDALVPEYLSLTLQSDDGYGVPGMSPTFGTAAVPEPPTIIMLAGLLSAFGFGRLWRRS